MPCRTCSRWWKQREEEAARVLGAHRQPLSGSAGREDRSRSDSTHETIFIECKVRQTSTIRELWEATKALALKEKKVPVVFQYDKGRQGPLMCFHADDFEAVMAAWIFARNREAQEADLHPSAIDRRED
jgi:hypothetical protein